MYKMPVRLLFIALILIAIPAFGANYYIDLDDAGTGSAGTVADPWSWADFVSAGVSASHDYRFKCGTDYNFTTSTGFTINATGNSAEDPIFFGAYESDGDHEDDHPSFGLYCQDGTTEKPKFTNSTAGDFVIIALDDRGNNQYIELNSLYIADASGETASGTYHNGVDIRSQYNVVRYMYIVGPEWGITTHSTHTSGYNTIEYNYINMNDATDEDTWQGDAIRLDKASHHNTVQYNSVGGYDHGGINFQDSTYNTVQYNYGWKGAGHEDFFIGSNFDSDNNTIAYNFSNEAGQGLEIFGGNSNLIYGNIFTCGSGSHPSATQGCAQFQSGSGSTYSSSNNKFYNNTIYDGQGSGILLLSQGGNGMPVSGNQFYNNVILTTVTQCIRVADVADVVGTYTFYNNSCYDYVASGYAYIEGTTYANSTTFNALGFASGNREDDPGLNNPASHQLWPASALSNVVEAGYNVGTPYDYLLHPNGTDFTASPPTVDLEQQATDYIGAYGLSGGKRRRMIIMQ